MSEIYPNPTNKKEAGVEQKLSKNLVAYDILGQDPRIFINFEEK